LKRNVQIFLALLLVLAGCFAAPRLAPADLSEPGWTVRRGQAVWHPRRDAPEIAGDLLIATRADGSVFAQFTKTPFPFAVAQAGPHGWQIEFPPQNRRYSGRGAPPARVVWFQLARALAGAGVAKPWSWRGTEADWHLANAATGESLEGYLTR